jgi:hypothetical protein
MKKFSWAVEACTRIVIFVNDMRIFEIPANLDNKATAASSGGKTIFRLEGMAMPFRDGKFLNSPTDRLGPHRSLGFFSVLRTDLKPQIV